MFAVRGMNILTFSMWVCETVDTYEEALDLQRGYTRLESNPHIEYEIVG